MRKLSLKDLNHRDRVKCVTNKKLKDLTFTINKNKDNDYLRLYQVNPNVLFDKKGQCLQTTIKSHFKVGDKLEFFKSDIQYKLK